VTKDSRDAVERHPTTGYGRPGDRSLGAVQSAVPPGIRRVARVLGDVGLPFLMTRLVLLAVTLSVPSWPRAWSARAVPDEQTFLSRTPDIGGLYLGSWYQWDAAWYLRIAANGPEMGYSGYTEDPTHRYSAYAFFPLYPLSVRAAATLAPGALTPVAPGKAPPPQLLVVALLVANLACALALLALYVWATRTTPWSLVHVGVNGGTVRRRMACLGRSI